MRTLFTLLLFMFSLNAFCQDTIVTTGKRTHIGKIYEIDSLKKEVRIKTDMGHSVFVPFDAVKSISTNSNDSFKNTNPEINKDVKNDVGSKSPILTIEQKIEILKMEVLNIQENLNSYHKLRRSSRFYYIGGGILTLAGVGVGSIGIADNEASYYILGGMMVFMGSALQLDGIIKSIKAEKYLKNASISPNVIKFKF